MCKLRNKVRKNDSDPRKFRPFYWLSFWVSNKYKQSSRIYQKTNTNFRYDIYIVRPPFNQVVQILGVISPHRHGHFGIRFLKCWHKILVIHIQMCPKFVKFGFTKENLINLPYLFLLSFPGLLLVSPHICGHLSVAAKYCRWQFGVEMSGPTQFSDS